MAEDRQTQNVLAYIQQNLRNHTKEDIISVWNKTASDQHTTIRIRDTLKRILNLPPNTIIEYKTHNDSLRDKSSFRNTDMFLH